MLVYEVGWVREQSLYNLGTDRRSISHEAQAKKIFLSDSQDMGVFASSNHNSVYWLIMQAPVAGLGVQTLCWCMSGGCPATSQSTPCGASIRLPLGGYKPALVRSLNQSQQLLSSANTNLLL